jgi:uncharacterized protein (TIGR03382 family)
MIARCVALVVASAAMVSSASAQTPQAPAIGEPSPVPSRLLERGIKLYDKRDFFSASIELAKVLAREGSDDVKNLQRAEFFQAKTFYQLGFYVASLARLLPMLKDPSHSYHGASLKWLAAVGRHPGLYAALPNKLADGIALATLDDPMLASVIGEVRFALARTTDDARQATSLVNPIQPDAPIWPHARLAVARLHLREQPGLSLGIMFASEAARDPALANDAIREVLIATHAHGERALAKASMVKFAGHHAAAAFASSRFAIEETASVPGLDSAPILTFEGLVVATTCFGGATPDIFSKLDPAIMQHVDALLRIDDNAALLDEARAAMTATRSWSWAASHATPLFIRFVLDDPETREMLALEAELAHELTALERTDRAWQTTQPAAEIVQELTVQQSVVRADLGKRFRDRLDQARRELEAMDLGKLRGAKLEAGPRAMPGAGFVVADEACAALRTVPGIPRGNPGTVMPRRGCGCTSSSPSSGAAIVLAFVLLGYRRRRPMRMSAP